MAIKYAMTYQSTRGEDEGAGYSDIVLKGLAADGGLFMPRIYPQVTKTDLEDWRHLSYAELAFEILRLFATDIEEDTLKTMLAGVYREDVYNNGRTGEDFSKITPTRSIDGGKIRILELSNGPTLAFKDMAMQRSLNTSSKSATRNSIFWGPHRGIPGRLPNTPCAGAKACASSCSLLRDA